MKPTLFFFAVAGIAFHAHQTEDGNVRIEASNLNGDRVASVFVDDWVASAYDCISGGVHELLALVAHTHPAVMTSEVEVLGVFTYGEWETALGAAHQIIAECAELGIKFDSIAGVDGAPAAPYPTGGGATEFSPRGFLH